MLEKSAKSLKEITGYGGIHIRIYDDCSSEYGEAYLRQLFPEAETIIVHKKNHGADENTSMMYEDFLKSGDDILFNADSDILYHKDILRYLIWAIGHSDGFVTLLNVPSHPAVAREGNGMLRKEVVGAAGCCLTRRAVRLSLKGVRSRKSSFDTKMCVCLRERGIRILCTEKSYVQHIGVAGQNSDFFSFDYGLGFDCGSLLNAQIIEEAFESYVSSIYAFKQSRIGKLYGVFITLYRRMKKLRNRQQGKGKGERNG